MKFGNLENIYYFIPLVLISTFMIFGIKKRNGALKILKIQKNNNIYIIKTLCIVFGSLMIYIALLSPQKLLKEKEVEVKGNNIYILVDTSLSMLTEDVYPNRLELGKKVIKEVLIGMKGDKIGIIPFSDSAYIQMPLTEDYSIVENYLNAIDTNLISGGGTNILEALVIANKSFEEIGGERKIILIVSDGGEKDENILEYAKAENIIVYSIGVGTEKGEVIPNIEFGKRSGFVKDSKGSIVVSKLNTKFLEELSIKTKGNYYEVNNIKNNTKRFVEDIKKIDKEKFKNEKIPFYKKYYQYFLLVGFFLVLFGYFFNRRLRYEK